MIVFMIPRQSWGKSMKAGIHIVSSIPGDSFINVLLGDNNSP